MNPPIRYVEREDRTGFSDGDFTICEDGKLVPAYRTKHVLQYQTPTGEWVDVPVVRENE